MPLVLWLLLPSSNILALPSSKQTENLPGTIREVRRIEGKSRPHSAFLTIFDWIFDCFWLFLTPSRKPVPNWLVILTSYSTSVFNHQIGAVVLFKLSKLRSAFISAEFIVSKLVAHAVDDYLPVSSFEGLTIPRFWELFRNNLIKNSSFSRVQWMLVVVLDCFLPSACSSSIFLLRFADCWTSVPFKEEFMIIHE